MAGAGQGIEFVTMIAPASSSPSTVLFDLGGVLVDWNPRYLYRGLIADEEAMEQFLSQVCSPAWNLETDRGWKLTEATAHLVARFPDHRELIEAYFARWIEMVRGPFPETVALLRALSERGVPLFAVTNWSSETFPLVRDAQGYEFLGLFQRLFVSGEMGLIKPERSYFEHVLAAIERLPQDCLFIDDNAANIAAAREMGFVTHHFSSPATLREDLYVHGFLS